jgi:hypothetical protein
MYGFTKACGDVGEQGMEDFLIWSLNVLSRRLLSSAHFKSEELDYDL